MPHKRASAPLLILRLAYVDPLRLSFAILIFHCFLPICKFTYICIVLMAVAENVEVMARALLKYFHSVTLEQQFRQALWQFSLTCSQCLSIGENIASL